MQAHFGALLLILLGALLYLLLGGWRCFAFPAALGVALARGGGAWLHTSALPAMLLVGKSPTSVEVGAQASAIFSIAGVTAPGATWSLMSRLFVENLAFCCT